MIARDLTRTALAFVALATACVCMTTSARADVALSFGGALAAGNHTTLDGTISGNGEPLPIVDLDAGFDRIAFHAESVPYVVTPHYGNPGASSLSRISTLDGTVRAFEPHHRFALGIGYGALFTTVDRTAPSGALTLEATGLRLEAFERMRIARATSLELTLGGIPHGTGTLVTRVGIPGAASPDDAIVGSQIDASVRATDALRGPFALAYGVRYRSATYRFARSNAQVERDALLLPFVEVRVRL